MTTLDGYDVIGDVHGHADKLARLLACVDSSVGNGGPLVAYRWSGERTLSDDHMVAAR